MKMKEADFESLRNVLDSKVANRLDLVHEMRMYRDEWGLTPMRFRWDCLNFAGGVPGHLYAYLNDDHIDSALREYMRLCGLDWAATLTR